jgi:hypothetical protein
LQKILIQKLKELTNAREIRNQRWS